MWLLYLFFISLILTDATITAVLTYISYQFFQARQRVVSFWAGVAALICAANLVIILTSIF